MSYTFSYTLIVSAIVRNARNFISHVKKLTISIMVKRFAPIYKYLGNLILSIISQSW